MREQLGECFEQTSCYLLPHPGFSVTQKSYDGAIGKIRRPFRLLLARYVDRVFTRQLCAKRVHGHFIAARPPDFRCQIFRGA